MRPILVPYHLDEHLDGHDWPVRDDLDPIIADLPEGDPWLRMAALYEKVADAVAQADGVPVVVSGDCTTSLGTVAGLQRRGVDPVIVWFDGHGDVQTLETTGSGYIGGMPLRVLTGYRPELIATSLGLRVVPEERVVLVDARDLDPPERDYLATSAVRRVPVEELTAGGVPDGPVYLHVDVDVFDPGDLPGLLFPALDGPPAGAVAQAVRRVLDTGRVVAAGLACTWRTGVPAAERLGELLPVLTSR